MNIDAIIRTVSGITNRYSDRDPARLCRYMDILLAYEPMGAAKQACKGFFFRKLGVSVITVNSELTDTFRKLITAHELGHAVLHADMGERGLLDYGYFDKTNECEREANFFAAELLLTDSDMYEALYECSTYYEIAQRLYVPAELADLKLQIMEHKGCDLHAPRETAADFMGKLDVRYGEGS